MVMLNHQHLFMEKTMSKLTFKYIEAEDPTLEDDTYECVEFPRFHIQDCLYGILSDNDFSVVEKLENGAFRFKDGFTSLGKAKAYIQERVS